MTLRLDETMKMQATDTPSGVRMGDVMSFERTDLPEANIAGMYQVSEEQEKKWKAQGKIGYFEQAIRQDKTEMIPFNPEGAIKAIKLLNVVNRLKQDRYEEETNDRCKHGRYAQAMETSTRTQPTR